MDLGGTAPGNFDVLEISSQADLLGTLNITILASYIPVVGDTLDIITFGSTTGSQFTNVKISDAGVTIKVNFLANTVRLTIQ